MHVILAPWVLPAAGMSLAGMPAIAIRLPKHPGAGGFGPFSPGYPQDVTFGEGLVSFWGRTSEFVALGGAG